MACVALELNKTVLSAKNGHSLTVNASEAIARCGAPMITLTGLSTLSAESVDSQYTDQSNVAPTLGATFEFT